MCRVTSCDRHMIHVGSEAPVVKRGPVSLAVYDVLQTSAALQRVDSTLSRSIKDLPPHEKKDPSRCDVQHHDDCCLTVAWAVDENALVEESCSTNHVFFVVEDRVVFPTRLPVA